jgi:hypothetical protein
MYSIGRVNYPIAVSIEKKYYEKGMQVVFAPVLAGKGR